MFENKYVRNFFKRRGFEDESELYKVTNEKLKDIDLMVEKLHEIKENDEIIVVLPDFDCDGISAGILSYAALKEMGFNAYLYSSPTTEDYGFYAHTIDRICDSLKDKGKKINIYTCDVGITCDEGVKRAKELGLTVLITDHHREDKNIDVRMADVIVNPMRYDEEYTFGTICGAVVTYKVMKEYAMKYASVLERDNVNRLVVFAMIGTISDLMPMLDENREYVRHGLKVINMLNRPSKWFVNSLEQSSSSKEYRNVLNGLTVLLNAFEEAGKIKRGVDINESFIGYYLAPTLNSVRRLMKPMSDVFGLFILEDKAEIYARDLLMLNEKRKEIVAETVKEIKSKNNIYSSRVLECRGSKSMLGLFATDILNTTGLPVMVVTKYEDPVTKEVRYSGSCRSPKWFKILDFLKEKGITCGGHSCACGVELSEEEYKTIGDDIDNEIKAFLEARECSDEELGFDADIDISSADFLDLSSVYEFIEIISQFAPFGPGFEEPMVRLRVDTSEASAYKIGTEKQHSAVYLPYDMKVLKWNNTDLFLRVMESKNNKLEFEGKATISEFNDNVSFDLFV